mgnify:FL=1
MNGGVKARLHFLKVGSVLQSEPDVLNRVTGFKWILAIEKQHKFPLKKGGGGGCEITLACQLIYVVYYSSHFR